MLSTAIDGAVHIAGRRPPGATSRLSTGWSRASPRRSDCRAAGNSSTRVEVRRGVAVERGLRKKRNACGGNCRRYRDSRVPRRRRPSWCIEPGRSVLVQILRRWSCRSRSASAASADACCPKSDRRTAAENAAREGRRLMMRVKHQRLRVERGLGDHLASPACSACSRRDCYRDPRIPATKTASRTHFVRRAQVLAIPVRHHGLAVGIDGEPQLRRSRFRGYFCTPAPRLPPVRSPAGSCAARRRLRWRAIRRRCG